MLYDKRWDEKVTVDPLSPEAFIAWLETKNPRKKYNFSNCEGGCLLDQFMAYNEGKHDDNRYNLYHFAKIGDSHFGQIASLYPQTFGAALKRAKEAYGRG